MQQQPNANRQTHRRPLSHAPRALPPAHQQLLCLLVLHDLLLLAPGACLLLLAAAGPDPVAAEVEPCAIEGSPNRLGVQGQVN